MKILKTFLVLLACVGTAFGVGGYGGRAGLVTGGSGATVNNYITNTIRTYPAWLSATQTLSGTNFPTTITINPSNGCAVTLWATNALSADTAITLTLPNLSSNLTAMVLNVVASNTTVTTTHDVYTAYIWSNGVFGTAIELDWDESYFTVQLSDTEYARMASDGTMNYQAAWGGGDPVLFPVGTRSGNAVYMNPVICVGGAGMESWLTGTYNYTGMGDVSTISITTTDSGESGMGGGYVYNSMGNRWEDNPVYYVIVLNNGTYELWDNMISVRYYYSSTIDNSSWTPDQGAGTCSSVSGYNRRWDLSTDSNSQIQYDAVAGVYNLVSYGSLFHHTSAVDGSSMANDNAGVGDAHARRFVYDAASTIAYKTADTTVTNLFSLVWPANVYSSEGAAVRIAPTAEITTNQFNLLWRGDRYEVSKQSNQAPVSN